MEKKEQYFDMHSKQAKMIVYGPLQHPNMGTKFKSNDERQKHIQWQWSQHTKHKIPQEDGKKLWTKAIQRGFFYIFSRKIQSRAIIHQSWLEIIRRTCEMRTIDGMIYLKQCNIISLASNEWSRIHFNKMVFSFELFLTFDTR